MPNEENNTNAVNLLKDVAGIAAGKVVSNYISPVAGNVLGAGLFIYNHREGIAELHNANVKYEADNYRKYRNDTHLNFDTTAPLAGHYNNTNIGQNISNVASNFNNSFSKAINDNHNDYFHSDTKFLGSNSYSNSGECELI